MQQVIAILQNYKTTLAGISGIVTVLAKVGATGHFDLGTDGAALAIAAGLLFAHDGKAQ